jgi:dTDP-4-dehydrorhamnose reductase
MIGGAVREHCKSIGDTVLAYDHRALDISDSALVLRKLADQSPEVVINCAAWTDVDGCERDNERAFAANARGPENLANACLEMNATLVTISTDYVFDGTKDGFYTQDDQPNPLSVYAVSKLEGERCAQAACPKTVVVRTGFVFGSGGTNFLSTIIDRARSGEKIRAISDAYGTPTYARDLAFRLRELAQLNRYGVFHVTNTGGGASFEQFASEAVLMAGCVGVQVEGVQMDSLKRPAPRPRNSRLRCLYSAALGLPPLPDWRDALRKFVREH